MEIQQENVTFPNFTFLKNVINPTKQEKKEISAEAKYKNQKKKNVYFGSLEALYALRKLIFC